MPIWIYLAGALGLFAAGLWTGHEVTHNAWVAELADQQKAADDKLLAATQRADAAEAKAKDLNLTIEAEHADHQHALDAARADLVAHARELERLHLRAGHCDRGAVPAAAQPAAGPAQGAAGPADVQGSYEELARLAGDADDVAEYARACHAWAVSAGKPERVRP